MSERREKKKSGIYDFSGAPSEKREENDIQGPTTGGSAAVPAAAFGGTAIFQTVFPAARPRSPPPMPNGHSLFFPECPRKHPVYVVYPLPIATKFTLSLGTKIRVVAATQAVWGHVYEKLSHPLETIIGTHAEKETPPCPPRQRPIECRRTASGGRTVLSIYIEKVFGDQNNSPPCGARL